MRSDEAGVRWRWVELMILCFLFLKGPAVNSLTGFTEFQNFRIFSEWRVGGRFVAEGLHARFQEVSFGNCSMCAASLPVLEAGFGEIDVALDAAEDFIADDVFIAQVDDGLALVQECGEREALVLGGEAAQRGAGSGGGGAFHLADVILVFEAEAPQGIRPGGDFFFDDP